MAAATTDGSYHYIASVTATLPAAAAAAAAASLIAIGFLSTPVPSQPAPPVTSDHAAESLVVVQS